MWQRLLTSKVGSNGRRTYSGFGIWDLLRTKSPSYSSTYYVLRYTVPKKQTHAFRTKVSDPTKHYLSAWNHVVQSSLHHSPTPGLAHAVTPSVAKTCRMTKLPHMRLALVESVMEVLCSMLGMVEIIDILVVKCLTVFETFKRALKP